MTILEIVEGVVIILISLIYLYFWKKRDVETINIYCCSTKSIWIKINNEWKHIGFDKNGSIYLNGSKVREYSSASWARSLTDDEWKMLFNNGEGLKYDNF